MARVPTSSRRLWIAAIAAILALVGIAAALPLEDWAEDLMSAMQRMDLLGGLALFCAGNVVATLLMAPSAPMGA